MIEEIPRHLGQQILDWIIAILAGDAHTLRHHVSWLGWGPRLDFDAC